MMRIFVLLQFTKKMLSAFHKIELVVSVSLMLDCFTFWRVVCVWLSLQNLLLAQEPSPECFGILYFLAVHKKCLEIICQKFVHNFHANLLLALFDRSRRRRVVDVEKVFEMWSPNILQHLVKLFVRYRYKMFKKTNQQIYEPKRSVP